MFCVEATLQVHVDCFMQIKYFSLFWVVNKRADPLQMTFQGQHHSCWHLMGASYVPVTAWAGNTHSFIQQTSAPFMRQALLWMLEMQQWVNRENSVLLELNSGEGMMISRQVEQSIRCVRWWNEADTAEGEVRGACSVKQGRGLPSGFMRSVLRSIVPAYRPRNPVLEP